MKLKSEYILIAVGVISGWEGAFISDLVARHLRPNERLAFDPVRASYARAIMTGMNMYDRTGVKPGCRGQTAQRRWPTAMQFEHAYIKPHIPHTFSLMAKVEEAAECGGH